jgi:hypothetical protein
MDPTHRHYLLEKKETFLTFVNLDGINGVTIESTPPPFPTNRKSWGEFLDQQGEKKATKMTMARPSGHGVVTTQS